MAQTKAEFLSKVARDSGVSADRIEVDEWKARFEIHVVITGDITDEQAKRVIAALDRYSPATHVVHVKFLAKEWLHVN